MAVLIRPNSDLMSADTVRFLMFVVYHCGHLRNPIASSTSGGLNPENTTNPPRLLTCAIDCARKGQVEHQWIHESRRAYSKIHQKSPSQRESLQDSASAFAKRIGHWKLRAHELR